MGKIAFIFSGQGAQYPGMGRQIVEAYPASACIYDTASEALGIDIRKMIFEGTEDTLKITENTQPAILTMSIACLQPVISAGISPDVVAGLSLGEYTALVAAHVIDFKDAVKIVRRRGKYMQEAVPVGVGAMAAILGLDGQLIAECCRSASDEGVVEPANYNCPGQVVISGEVKAVEKAMSICSEKGAKRTTMLQVSAPFHCSLMKPAGARLKEDLEKVAFSDPRLPVISNVTATYITYGKESEELLVKQVSSPVLWESTIDKMVSAGVDTFIEIGPGKVLCGFVKKISKEARAFNVEDIDSLNKTLFELKGGV